jgi:hypothetical protein
MSGSATAWIYELDSDACAPTPLLGLFLRRSYAALR